MTNKDNESKEYAVLEAAYHERGNKIDRLIEENLNQLEEINALKCALYLSRKEQT